MRWCKCLFSLASAVTLCGPVYATTVVAEHNGHRLGIDYDITLVSQITILRPSLPGVPYDFDCYDSQTQAPASIQWIKAVAGIGNVEVMVRPHQGRLYGASDVNLLQLNQTGVTGTVLEMLISGNLGQDGPTIFANGGSAEGALDFHNALSPITITGRLLGNFTCISAGGINIAGDVVAASTITLTNLDSLVIRTSDVPANLEGTLRLLNGLPQPPAPENVVVIHGALNGTIDLNHGDVRQGAMLRAMRGGHGHLINGGVTL
jgi:hypothetical protein